MVWVILRSLVTYTLRDTEFLGTPSKCEFTVRMRQPRHCRGTDEEGQLHILSENTRLRINMPDVSQ
jgi:hypothetical protein